MADQSAQELLRQQGLRVTPQRQGVLSLFLSEPGFHWSADQVRERLLPAMPGLARGTTYKVLNELVKVGLCEELATAEGTALYGIRLVPHHHFYCTQCRRWFDVDVAGISELKLMGSNPDASVHQVDVTFRGVCRACAKSGMKARHDYR